MADYAHKQTDNEIKKLERKLRKVYAQAINDLEIRMNEYLEKFKKKDEKKREALKQITDKQEYQKAKKEYEQWRLRRISEGQRWVQLRESIANDILNVNKIATAMINDELPEVYALNHNYATYQCETAVGVDTSYILHDRDTVRRLLKDDPYLYARSQLSNIKDLMYNKKNIQSSLIQAVLQGKSIPEIAQDLAAKCGWSNCNSSIRTARTFMTNAQNAGRYDGYERATKHGIDLTLVWAATLDGRTRHEHRQLDGQRREVGQPFEVDGIKIKYPADFGGGEYKVPADMIYNCRCTIVPQIKGYEYEIAKTSPKLKGMSYDEWKNEKAVKKNEKTRVQSQNNRQQETS